MTPERWIRAQELYFAAIEIDAGSRAAFLEEACRGDAELRREVESLLSTSSETPSGFLESPAIDAIPALSPTEKAGSRSIRKGTRLGPYEILAPLGSGGMGEVYRARDERLGREVAIKVLSGELTADSGRLRRFEKEARSASALNHPNIVTIHEVGSIEGIAYIAMEKVDGQTLRELVKAPLAIKRLLPIATQIAEGLAKAHEAGIVHRDLKPENVMVTKEGLVKILDFGLAKLTSKSSGSGEGAELPTMTGTTPGVIMGTVGYMSPEQANGAAVDARSDQFSFGSMLYEMVTGKRAFEGKTPIDVLGAIVNDEPQPIATLNPRVPAPLRWTVERCLAKEPGNRYASTEDLARDLATIRDHLSEATSGVDASPGVKLSVRRRLAWIVTGAALVLGTGIGYVLANRTSLVKAPRYSQITFRRGGITGARFTPDGQSVVYSARWDGKPLELYSIRLGNPESVPLGLPPAHLLSIARNGDMAILLDPVDRGPFYLGTLARAPLGGGAPRQISMSVSDADWSPSGQLALLRFTDEATQVLEYPAGNVLYRIQNSRDHPSGAAAPWMQSPRVSPDGRLVAFIEHPLWNESAGAIAVVDLSGRKRVISAGWDGVGSPAGWDGAGSLDWSPRGDELWFTAEGRADTPGFAIRAVNLSGKDRVVLSGPGRFGLRDLSRDGRLLMERGTLRSTTLFGGQGLERERDLSWSDISGVVGLTADGKTLLFSSGARDNGVYLRGTDGGPVAHLGEAIPTGLSPDGTWVSTKAEGSEVLTLIPTGPGEPRVLSLPGLDDVFAMFPRWFPDSKHLIVSARRGKEGRRCYLVDFEGGAPRPVTPEESRLAWGFDGWSSPDGKWVTAGEEDDTLVLFPIGSGEPRRVRGLAPNDKFIQWSADGRWLYIRTLNHEWPMRVFRFDLETGRRELWKEIMPRDVAGVEEPNGAAIRITPDGKSYAFSVANSLSELYVVDRVR